MLNLGTITTKDRVGNLIAHELSEEKVYFTLQYLDENLLVPIIQTLVYLGKNLDGEGSDLYYFQDIDSYQDGGGYPNHKGTTGQVFTLPEKALINIFALDGLVRELSFVLSRAGPASA